MTRHSKSNGGQVARIGSPLPTPAQIAELNALLRETQQLAKELNFPLTNVVFNATTEIVRSLFITELVESFILNILRGAQKNYPMLFWPGIIILIPTIYYLYYQLFQLYSAMIGKFIPNGLGFSREQHSAYEMQKKLGTQAEVEALIQSLKILIQEQRSSNRYTLISLAATLLIPFVSAITVTKSSLIFNGGKMSLINTVFGPAVSFESPTAASPLPSFVKTIAYDQQAISFVQFLQKRWSNFRISRQLQQEAKRFNSLSGLLNAKKNQWQVIQKQEHGKEATILLLDLSNQHSVQLVDALGRSPTINKADYVIELHRLLLEAKLPVYVTTDDKVYIGFSGLSDRQASRLRNTLNQRLLDLIAHENEIESSVNILNSIGEQIQLPEVWSSYTTIDENVKRVTTYYLDLANIPNEFLDAYMQVLNEVVPQQKRTEAGNIISIKGAVKAPENFSRLLLNLLRLKPSRKTATVTNIFESADFCHTPAVATSSTSVETVPKNQEVQESKAYKRNRSPVVSVSTDETDKRKNKIYPESIQFSGRIRFFRDEMGQQKKSANFAYPIRVPYLPEGRAYAVVDTAVFSYVAEHVSEEQIVAKLDNGRVHGYRQGGEGIQIVGQDKENPPSYKDVQGNSHVASVKIKLGNVRIFGYKAEETVVDGEPRILFRFNGPARGH